MHVMRWVLFILISQIEESESQVSENKYLVKPPKDLKSKFEEKMAEKKRKEFEEAERKIQEEEEEKRLVSWEYFDNFFRQF